MLFHLLIILLFNVFLVQYLYTFLILLAGGYQTKKEFFLDMIPGSIVVKLLISIVGGIAESYKELK